MTTQNPVSCKTQNPVSSKETSRPINKFLFDVVNNFTLDEFKKYTNLPDVIRELVMAKMKEQPDVPDPFSLHDRVRHNFKKLPDENWWKRGLFSRLKLKNKFYRSDLAKRIFKKIYGLKSCAVRIERLVLPTVSGHSVNLEEPPEVPSQIELKPPDESTISNSSPKRRLKYALKQIQSERQPPDSHFQSKHNRPSKRNIAPMTRVHQRDVVYEEDKEELSVRLPAIDVSSERLQKAKAGPKSIRKFYKNSSADSQSNTNDKSPTKESHVKNVRFQESPSKISAPTLAPTTKPLIAPKPVKLNLQLSQLPNVTQSMNVIAKRKIGPKSFQSKFSSVEDKPTPELERDLPHTVVPSISNSTEKSTERLKNSPIKQHSNEPCKKSLPLSNIISNDGVGEKIKQSVERASQHLNEYLAKTDPDIQSINHFWYYFLKAEYEDVSSAAETQLFASQNDVESEVNDVE